MQLGVNVFLAYPTLKYLRKSCRIERAIYHKTLSRIHSPRRHTLQLPNPQNKDIFLLAEKTFFEKNKTAVYKSNRDRKL